MRFLIFCSQLMTLCKNKELNITLSDIQSLSAYSELLAKAGGFEMYVASRIENFYEEIIDTYLKSKIAEVQSLCTIDLS